MSEPNWKGAIFDLDGTLVDSMSHWRKLPEKFLADYGRYPDDQDKKALEKMTLRQGAYYAKNRYCPEESVEELYRALVKKTEEIYTLHCALKPGVAEYLQELKKKKIPMAVATLANKKHAKKALARLGIKKYFSFVMTDEDVGKGKEEPDLYLAAAKRLKLAPKDCAVFEDGVSFGAVAKQAGFTVYAVKDPDNEARYGEFAAAMDGEAPWQ